MKLFGIILRVPFFVPRFNIAPTQMAPVIFHDHGRPTAKLMRWGLILPVSVTGDKEYLTYWIHGYALKTLFD